MKKIILFLLLIPFLSFGQTANGTETKANAFRALSPQTVTSPTFLTTTGTDGTQGKSSNIVSQINSSNNSGILSGGALAVNADPTKFNIAEGVGYVMNSLTGVATKVTWSTATAQTTPYLLTSVATYVLKDNAGATVLQNTAPTPAQYRTHIYIGKLAHTTFTTILFAVTEPSRMFDSTGQVADINKFLGSGNIEGNVITYNGANLNINASAGMTYRPGANYLNDRNSPSITTESSFTAGTFRNKFRNGSGGWSAVNTTTIDPNYYDDGTGILALVPNNKWTIKVFWRFGGTGTIHCDYGQTVYDSKAQALEAVGKAVTSEDPETKRDASKRGWLVVKQGITVLNDITTAEFLQADKFGERASGGSSTATMQTAYDNSVTPQIITSTGLGAVALKRGSAADTDNVLVVQNGAGSDTFTVKGNGDITGGLYNSYTPANDANVVHLTGNETISGIKSFTSAPRFDLGASFKSPSTVYQAINALNDGWALGVGSVTQSLIFNTSTNYAYTFPSATGTIALTSDLAGLVSGTLTSGYIPKATGTSTLGNSLIYDNGTNVGVSTINPLVKLQISQPLTLSYPTLGTSSGALFISGDLTLNTYGLYHGINSNNGHAWLQSMRNDSAVAYPILLNPVGGNVLIGTTTDDGVNKLQVNGSGYFSSYLGLGNSDFSTLPTGGNMVLNSGGTGGQVSFKNGSTLTGFLYNAPTETSISYPSVGSFNIQKIGTGTVFSINSSNVVKINNLSGTGIRMVTADASGNLSTTVGYKVYTALLTQSGTSAPTATILENTLGTVTFGYTSAGSYTATSSSLFTSNKTTVFTQELFGLDSKAFEQITGASNINLFTSSGGAYINGLYSATLIEIRVYN